MEKFDFLQWFEGIVVSGVEKTRKPFPEFYEILLTRYQLVPGKSVFIDDNIKNVDAAQKLGIQSIHFQSPTQLHSELSRIGLIGADR